MKWNIKNSIILIIVLLIGALFFTPIGSKIQHIFDGLAYSDEVKKEDGKVEVYDVELLAYNGLPNTNLKNFKGKVMFINFWGSWCEPCRIEMPGIQKLYEAKGNQVEFILIASQDKPKAFLPYLEKNNFTFPVYEAASPMAQKLKPTTFPTTLIIDKNGEVVLKYEKSRDWNEADVHELLEELLN